MPDPTSTAAHTAAHLPRGVIGDGLRTIVNGLHHPEGVCWSPADERLYAGGEGGEIYGFGLRGGTVDTLCTVPGGSMLGIAQDGDGYLYACDVGNKCIQQISPDGETKQYGASIDYPNFPVFDAAGKLWVSDSGQWGEATGAVVRIDPDGTTERVLDGLHFANGLAVRDEWLYIVESTWPRIIRVPLAGGDPETVIVLDRAVPDGLAFDDEGGLWISCWQPNRVYRLAPAGRLDIIVDDWSGVYAPTPTNVAFAGADLDVLALASLATSGVSACDPGFRGAPLHRPTGLVHPERK